MKIKRAAVWPLSFSNAKCRPCLGRSFKQTKRPKQRGPIKETVLFGRARIAWVARITRVARVRCSTWITWVAGIAWVTWICSRARIAWVAGIARGNGVNNRATSSRGIVSDALSGVTAGKHRSTANNKAGCRQCADRGAGKKSTILFTHFGPPLGMYRIKTAC